MNPVNPYSLIDILIVDQKISARPIQWDGHPDDDGNDAYGLPVPVAAYVTTCPFCGQLIQFNLSDIYIDINNNNDNIMCETCGKGNTRNENANEVLVVLDDEEIKPLIEQPKTKKIKPDNLFVDPLLNGDFDIQIDIDKFNAIKQ